MTNGERTGGARNTGSQPRSQAAPGPSARCNAGPSRGWSEAAPPTIMQATEDGKTIPTVLSVALMPWSATMKAPIPLSVTCTAALAAGAGAALPAPELRNRGTAGLLAMRLLRVHGAANARRVATVANRTSIVSRRPFTASRPLQRRAPGPAAAAGVRLVSLAVGLSQAQSATGR